MKRTASYQDIWKHWIPYKLKRGIFSVWQMDAYFKSGASFSLNAPSIARMEPGVEQLVHVEVRLTGQRWRSLKLSQLQSNLRAARYDCQDNYATAGNQGFAAALVSSHRALKLVAVG